MKGSTWMILAAGAAVIALEVGPRRAAVTLVAKVAPIVKESSGLARHRDFLITHPDHGNHSELFILDLSGRYLRTVEVRGARNKDWEDLAQSTEHLYVGDIGNNDHDRTELSIHRIAWSQLSRPHVASDARIDFRYPASAFDCEALVYRNGNLYLFTKELSGRTTLFRVPASSGFHVATQLGAFDANGRITAADISPDGSNIYLLGNDGSTCFLWILSGYAGDRFFSGQKRKVFLGSRDELGKAEGVLYKETNTLWISSESEGNAPSRLYEVSLLRTP